MNRSERARVLVIDNDPQVGADLAEMLAPYGMTVEFMCTDGLSGSAALVEAVARCAQRFRPHVAVVDVRLLDDYDRDTRAVFLLLPYLESCQRILYSAYLDNSVTREAWRAHVVDLVSKASSPNDLIQAVVDAASRKSRRAAEVAIHWPDGWNPRRLLAALSEDDANDAPETLFDDVVAQVIQGRSRITLHTMGSGGGGAPAASRGRSAVLELHADDLARSVLKLAKAERVRQEVKNYDAHVRYRLPGGFHTQLLGHALFWDVGGTHYSFVGTTRGLLPTFSKFYSATDDPQAILRPLHHFFNEVWIGHYRATASHRGQSLSVLYEETFGLARRLASIQHQPTAKGRILLAQDDVVRLNAWLTAAKERHGAVVGRVAVTHGDFHGDNIFTDGDHLWLIDFERTGLHHALLDFVELEVDIVTRLMAGELASEEAYTAFALACWGDGPTMLPQQINPELDNRNGVAKAQAVIQGVVGLAQTLCPDSTRYEHLLGLFYEVVYVTTISSISQEQRERALRLCRCLAQMLDLV